MHVYVQPVQVPLLIHGAYYEDEAEGMYRRDKYQGIM
jgi:hypothetical protein